MGNKETKVGIVSYGIYLPKDYETAEEIAKKSGMAAGEITSELGLVKKHKPGAKDFPVTMAVQAALQALENSKGLVSPDDIDVVLWSGDEYKDYIAQTASIRIQEEVKAYKAWAFDIIGQGVTTLTGIRLARDLMAGDSSVNTVLLAGGTRDIDLVDYTNPDTRWMLPTSVSGAAIILRRDFVNNSIMGMAALVDPEMADEAYVPVGGTVNRFSVDNVETKGMFFHVPNPSLMDEYLEERMPMRLAEVIGKALDNAGLAGKKPDYLAMRYLMPEQRKTVLSALEINADRTDSLSDAGHHGPNDVVISLDRAIKKGIIKKGSVVVLAAAGIGFTYSAAVMQC
ncbi:MAG TPA: 3-oxoacyl-[acyl-carrier-protein] synthase III C-terminal domain-containing protein [Smithellaceae bacterium]|nr:3-oxoacyl-[acyl-carrier-protein] synthase III C-terminal domain-containing protein [Smithellaceae bacterium]